jgi:glycosyltransferase involved in cell wall biosynthesis
MKSDINIPLISAVMIVYNGGLFIEMAIDSILRQTYSNFELLVLNDGSTDETEQIVKKISKGDERIKYSKNDINKGLAFARNQIINLAKGKYVVVTDADDISLPHRFETQLNFLNKNPDTHIIGSTVILIDEKGREYGNWDYPLTNNEIKKELKNACVIANPSCMFRKEVFDKIRGYNEGLVICEDWDFFYRASLIFNLSNIKESLIKYRVHNNNMSKNRLDETIVYSVYLSNNLPAVSLSFSLKKLVLTYPFVVEEVNQKIIKFYSFWIGTHSKLKHTKLSEELYYYVYKELGTILSSALKKEFLKKCAIIFFKNGNIKMTFNIITTLIK